MMLPPPVEFVQLSVFEFPADETMTEPVLAPAVVYDLETLAVGPERLSVPLQA